MASEQHDLVIIGGGPGGYAAALYGAAAGLDVAMIENRRIGGTCLNRGCIPAKELLQTAEVARTVRESDRFGVNASGDITLDFGTSTDRMWSVVDQLVNGLGSLLKNRKVTVFDGTGTLGADSTVTVKGADGEETTIDAANVILASGSVPRTIPGFDVSDRILTSDEVFLLEKLPDRVVVVGGGAIGCEFASTFVDMGSEVTILEALPAIMPGVDSDVVKVVKRALEKRGITIKTGVKVTGQTEVDGGVRVELEGGDSVEADTVVVSVGRRPLSDSLGLDGTGVEVDERGFVKVDEYCRTGVDGVFAVGDLIATPGLAHVAYAESILVIKQIMGEPCVPVDYGRVPWCIYSHPEVAFVGLTEEAAKAAGHDVVVSKHRWAGNGRAMILGETEGLVKIIAAKNDDGTGGQVLGVHMAGPWVTEQLGMGYLSVNWEATIDEIAQFIQPHPSLSENFGETVLTLTGRGLHG
ncbi:dihydrolipoyl dehydrogenase [Iamia sp. SCSIO 61187]|uniref:dihydrolipoyl dehydrogenase n=1 Tax=Iamia sp. SCSIO 61187 TaxID=2722752 RepID=UPI001C631002|nr:dihydrolipoyl dehydrogenase [Iamia sp. SCSIO 61187]QYG92339.1 dihydrolipoyl dehydrogenase [Iamia sp. SCSIO 61187]